MERKPAGRIIPIISLLVALSIIFGGCVQQGNNPPQDPTPGTADTDIPSTDDPSTDGPGTDDPSTDGPETDEPSTSDTEETLPENVRLFSEDEFFTPAEGSSPEGKVYTVDVLSFNPMAISSSDGRYLFAAAPIKDTGDYNLALLDFEDLTVTESTFFAGYPDGEYRSEDVHMVGGHPILCLRDTGILTVFDLSLNVTDTLDLNGGYQILLQGDDRFVYQEGGEHGNIFTVTVDSDGRLSKEEIHIPEIEDAESVYLQGAVGEDWIFFYAVTGAGWYRYIYDIKSGTMTALPTEGNAGFECACGYLCREDYDSGTVSLFDPSHPGIERRLVVTSELNDTGYYRQWTPTTGYIYYILTGEEVTRVAAVDPEDGIRTMELELESDSVYGYYTSFCEIGGYSVFLRIVGDRSAIWAAETGEAGETLPGFYALEGSDRLARENSELIKKIWEEYGVNVYTGNSAIRYLNSYAVIPEYGESKINTALKYFDDLFGICPEGFVREVVNAVSGIDVCLTGNIIPDRSNINSIGDAAAFVSDMGGLQVMVVDVNSISRRLLAHEFLHLIENAMGYIESERGGGHELFGRWELLNPPGFDYHWVYTDGQGNTVSGTGNYIGMDNTWTDVDEVYFVDGYSTAYPTEDRARVFEYIATYEPYSDAMPEYFKGEHMKLKVSYLCACLREMFESVANSPDVFWEQHADPRYDLEYFQTNYNWWPY